MIFLNTIFKSELRKKFISDSGWLFTERLIRLLINFFIIVLIARHLGPTNFGLYSFYLSIVLILNVISNLGLDFFLVKQLVTNKSDTNTILGTAFYSKLIASSLLFLLIVTSLFFVDLNPAERSILLIFSSVLIFRSFNWLEFYFQSLNKNKYYTLSSIISLIISSIINIYGIYSNQEIIFFVFTYCLEIILIYLICYSFSNRFLKISLIKLRFSKKLFLSFISTTWPIIISSFASIINLRIDQVFIGLYLNDEILGNYSASAKIGEAWLVVPAVLSISVFPILNEIRSKNYNRFRQLLNQSVIVLSLIGIAFCLIITLNTEIIIQLVFGDKYMLSSGYLKLYIWTGLPYFIFFAFGHLIYTEEIIDKSLLMSVSLIISNLVLNYILIDVYGAYGAIYATLISTFISYVILYFIVKKYTKFYK